MLYDLGRLALHHHHHNNKVTELHNCGASRKARYYEDFARRLPSREALRNFRIIEGVRNFPLYEKGKKKPGSMQS